ncbi:glycogen synthase GlgA [Natronospirillum operosum]|uniref:Glycogen synthase n=1 Tax=Natronospirillum operosum TaxID=2759953 RepID=A0A4Z0W6V5_9GAMM|nr:glycogen synthase GlgA [Natronospirillum operosum]TGG92935.1 glycogen synthase GlgA [Natronospirillum operosum]
MSQPTTTPRRILHVASEYEGLVKTGGLADVARALPAALSNIDTDVRVLIPCYRPLLERNFPKRLHSLSVPVNLTERYGCSVREWQDGNITVYLLEHNDFYDRAGLYDDGSWPYEDNPLRFALLTKAAFELCRELDFRPDILHSHDWQTALTGYYLRVHHGDDPFFAGTRVAFNVHNGAYQGRCHARWLSPLGIDPRHFTADHLEDHGEINLLKAGVTFSDAIIPVSPGYAAELVEEQTSHGLWQLFRQHQDRLQGILNGCDYGQWNPETDRLLPARFSAADLDGKAACKARLQTALGLAPEPDVPLFGLISRLTDQKGFHYLIPALHELMQHPVQLALLGSGDAHFAGLLRDLAAAYPGQVHFTEGYSDLLSHRIEAASDFFLMPSLFEPCGLNQIYSMRYGTLPIVRRTGGLRDTVVPLQANGSNRDSATGLAFDNPSIEDTLVAMEQAVQLYREQRELFNQVQQNAMRQRFTWDQAAQEYLQLYDGLMAQ